jgi:hypothetical protein
VVRDDQPDAREGQAGRPGESERFTPYASMSANRLLASVLEFVVQANQQSLNIAVDAEAVGGRREHCGIHVPTVQTDIIATDRSPLAVLCACGRSIQP